MTCGRWGEYGRQSRWAFQWLGRDLHELIDFEPNFDQQAFTPSVDVDGNGTVTVTYYDFRNNTPTPASLDTDYFAVSCESASENCASEASWEEERITPASFDIRMAPFARGYFLGDYMGLDNDGIDFASMFGQAFAQNDASQYFSRLTP